VLYSFPEGPANSDSSVGQTFSLFLHLQHLLFYRTHISTGNTSTFIQPRKRSTRLKPTSHLIHSCRFFISADLWNH